MADDRTGRRIFNNKTIKDRKSGCGDTCVAKDHEPYVVVLKKKMCNRWKDVHVSKKDREICNRTSKNNMHFAIKTLLT